MEERLRFNSLKVKQPIDSLFATEFAYSTVTEIIKQLHLETKYYM